MRALLLVFVSALIFASCKSPREKMIEKINVNEQAIKNDSMQSDMKLVADQAQLYLDFINKYPEDTLSVRYLYKAAEDNSRMRNFHGAVGLYRQFGQKYPDDPNAANSIFVTGFIYETELNNKDSAKVFYRMFLEKYPKHVLAPSAKFSLDQLEMGISSEELVKGWEAKLDSSQKK